MQLTRHTAAILVILSIFTSSLIPVMAASVGVQQGHWAKYTASAVGYDYSALTISISSVSGTSVSGTMTYQFYTGSPQTESFQGDVSRGETFPYIIPANLNEGDYIYYIDSFTNLRVQNVTAKSYVGATRIVVSAVRYGYTYYWDQQTGILVEQKWGTLPVTSSIKLTETNIWGGGIFDTSNPLFWVLVVVIIVVVAAVALVVLSSLRKKKPITETVTPSSSPEKSAKTKCCPKCGTSMPSDSIYCPKCGHKQPQT